MRCTSRITVREDGEAAEGTTMADSGSRWKRVWILPIWLSS